MNNTSTEKLHVDICVWFLSWDKTKDGQVQRLRATQRCVKRVHCGVVEETDSDWHILSLGKAIGS